MIGLIISSIHKRARKKGTQFQAMFIGGLCMFGDVANERNADQAMFIG